MLRACVAITALAGCLTPAPAVSPAPKADPDPKSLAIPPAELSKARELVQRLGSEAFAEREAAERELAEMGRRARPALLDGANLDPDPEIRLRCSTLLPKATTEEFKARLEAFLADTENKYEHDLPGWNKLRSVVRGEWRVLGWTFAARPSADKAARDLFLEFMNIPNGRKLLMALGGQPGELGRAVALYKQELFNEKFPRVPRQIARNPSVAEVALALFAESQVNSRHVPRTSALASVITSSGFPSAAQGGEPKAAALRSVLTAWFNSRTEPLDLYPALTLANATQNEAPAALLAGRILGTPGVQGFYKGQALTTLVRLKRLDDLPTIENAFSDSTALTTAVRIVNGKQVRETIEVRDAALAAALVLTGQKPSEYGFDAFPNTPGPNNFLYVWARISDEKRKEAFEKWKQWRAKNP